MSVRKNAISLRALSKITRGSSDVQRKQFGAITIARLLASIFVTWTTSGLAKICLKIENELIQCSKLKSKKKRVAINAPEGNV